MDLDFSERLAAFESGEYTELRPPQAHVLAAYASDYEDSPDIAIELPTGVGKTLIALLIADWALDVGRSVAYLTGTRQLAEQVEQQAGFLPGLTVHRFAAGHYPGADLDDYHQAQAIGVMNYWVYFNSSPRVEPADLVIFDDAHIAEQPLTGLFTLRIPRGRDLNLFRNICDLVLARTGAYTALRAIRDGTAPISTPPELLAFNDWAAVSEAAQAAIQGSDFVTSDEVRWVWPELRGRLDRCGVLIGPTVIEIRPYHPPTQTVPGYAQAKQRIYLSATLGTMGDLQRRLGTKSVVPISVPPALRQDMTGRRLFVVNPSTDPALSEEVIDFALEQADRAGRSAWLCASHAEADEIESLLRARGDRAFRLVPGDDSALERWRRSPKGHLVAAGRFDGLDFPDATCRLVILPSVPAASTEFERFVVAYLGDAAFMRHRVGQRVTQALGRANRTDDDWALYLGLDPGFAGMLANPAVRNALGAEVGPQIRRALELHGQSWDMVRQTINEFWSGNGVAEKAEAQRRPGRRVSGAHRADSAAGEVDAATALWLGDYPRAATSARDAANRLGTAGEHEHGAFWRYVEAHAHFARGAPGDFAAAKNAISDALNRGPRTAWFVRLRRTLDELEGLEVGATAHDDLFLSWDEWLREASSESVTAQIGRARPNMEGTHDQQVEALMVLARLCGARADRPSEQSATDAIWSWITPERGERRVWEVKTGTRAARIPREDVNQLLGQIEVDAQRARRARVFGCLLTPLSELEQDAAEAAREKVAVLHATAISSLFDLLADRFRTYQSLWGTGTAAERGEARLTVEIRLPRPGWLKRLLAPSQGICRMRSDVEAEFPQ